MAAHFLCAQELPAGYGGWERDRQSYLYPSLEAVSPDDDDGCSAIEMMDCSALAFHEYLGEHLLNSTAAALPWSRSS